MKAIVGLGNIGDKYLNTRHNAGFIAVDKIAKTYGEPTWTEKTNLQALISEVVIDGEKVMLCKPTTFMNVSGTAVAKIKGYFHLENKDILIIFDDIDLPLGIIKYKTKGSGGTHNGMKSVVNAIGEEVPRLRLGIEAREAESKIALDTYVLSEFKKEELELIEKNLDIIFISELRKWGGAK